MEILILIGIFAFVVAILFRSNEALDRVSDVEKEVKTIEAEMVHATIPTEETAPLTAPATEVSSSLMGTSTETSFLATEDVHMN